MLPDILDQMQQQYGWRCQPRTVAHDKASYFVAPRSQRLAMSFADALRDAELRSWLGGADADCSWLAGRLGDVYPHETAIAHIRRGLDQRYPRMTPGETVAQFKRLMSLVQDNMNSGEFAATGGGELASMALCLRRRCELVAQLEGGRLRT